MPQPLWYQVRSPVSYSAINPSHSGNLEDCLLKVNYKVHNVRKQLEPTGKIVTAEECGIACSKHEDCTAFSYTQYGAVKTCMLYGTADLFEEQVNTRQNITSGICPKSKKTLQEKGIEDIPKKAPNLQCVKEAPTVLCHFPFLFKGELQWDSLRDENGECKCSPADQEKATDQSTLIRYESMEQLENCTSCNSGE